MLKAFTKPGEGEYYASRPQAVNNTTAHGWVIRSRTTGDMALRTRRYTEAEFVQCQNDADALNEAYEAGVRAASGVEA